MQLKCLNNEKLYYIGGVVRDEILNRPCFDIDITLEGNAIEFCKNLNLENFEILQINDEFGTVRARLNNEIIDIASTRNETYPEKGHLPVVKDIGCSLKLDVLRRDFTINAIAKSVMTDEIIDYTGGLEDIKSKKLRVLHDMSFVDDPTRIVRGLKFGVRFGFDLEEHTLDLQTKYLENVNYDMSFKRLKKELIETFNLNKQEAYEKFFYYKIYKLLSKNIPEKFDYDIENLINNHSVNNIWLVYLGYLNLDNLPLTKIEKKIVEDYQTLITLKEPTSDYEIYKFFEKAEPESILIYIYTKNSEIGLRYFEIKDIKPAITGKNLIQLGYKPSKEFDNCFDYVLKSKLKEPNMSLDKEIELAKEYFANISEN